MYTRKIIAYEIKESYAYYIVWYKLVDSKIRTLIPLLNVRLRNFPDKIKNCSRFTCFICLILSEHHYYIDINISCYNITYDTYY